MTDPMVDFKRQAMAAVGLTPPESITPGKLHRIPSGTVETQRHRRMVQRLFPEGWAASMATSEADCPRHGQSRSKERMSDEERENSAAIMRMPAANEMRRKPDCTRKPRKKAADLWSKANPHPTRTTPIWPAGRLAAGGDSPDW